MEYHSGRALAKGLRERGRATVENPQRNFGRGSPFKVGCGHSNPNSGDISSFSGHGGGRGSNTQYKTIGASGPSEIKFNPEMIIRHYDIHIKLEEPFRPNTNVSKSDALMIANKLFSEYPTQFPSSAIDYDGKKNIHSAVELPTGRFKVTVSKGEDISPHTYAFTIKPVNSLELRKLYEGIQPSILREILQGMDVVTASDGPRGREISERFGIAVSKEMSEMTARVLKQPNLKPRQGDGQWNLLNNKVLNGKKIERWAVLDFSQNPKYRRHKPIFRSFPKYLAQRCNKLGIQMVETPLFYHPSNMDMLSNYDKLNGLLTYVHKRAERRLQILICVMAEHHNGYKIIKRICETEIGIKTQCCVSYLANQHKYQYLTDLALKISSKVGGSPIGLFNHLPHLDDDRHVIFIGANVNHPSGFNTSSPSIASVAASMNWPAVNQYAARICAQPHCTEKIQKLGEMCLELIQAYARMNKIKPGKIIFFRNGISESDKVLSEELDDLKKAIKSNGYSPTITVVGVQKPHLMRAYPKDESHGGNRDNIPVGTVIDTKIGFDFCTHNGILGMSEPNHYRALWDEHGFSSDEMQRLVYNLCYSFSHCSKPVSLVPPVYYAVIAAYRGCLYHEGVENLMFFDM
ncbi:protein argonaute 2-like [Tasmannia lanceolata]|uniref:protein argonaute 2-like n=1 Tax=Tasmannia lanceolata TaxID=3420 RepID=UPI0040638046